MDGLSPPYGHQRLVAHGTDHTSPSLLALSASRGIVPPHPQAWSKISLVAELASRFQQIRDQYGWVDHLGRAGVRYTERHGNDYGVIVRLPREQVALRSATRAAVLGAVGFEVLKQGMAIYLQTITRTPSGAVFGSTLGLLVFIYYASRFVLFVTAWAATSPENQTPEQEPVAVPGPAVIRAEVVIAPRPGAGAAAGLFGAGAVVGLLGAVLVRRR